jgi:hypothetical protein
MKPLTLATGLAAALALAALASGTSIFGRSAQATPVFAQRTGKGCPVCHSAPPNLNGTGKKFKANGYKW